MNIRFHPFKKNRKEHEGLSRRMFLMTTTMAGVTTSAMLGGASIASAASINEAQGTMLLRMVQDIYPHPGLLELSHYEAIVATIGKNADENPESADDLKAGLAKIDEQSQALYGKPYAELEDADAREGVLRHFQHEGFFQGVRWTAYFGIYDNKDIWPLFGYQGSSVEHGGYIDRGFSDITFVPEGPTLEERMAEVQG
ncbi:gluconate 2-dehydrogenase subunit 3 family protein [Leisingera sp. SS27]|uniref:gluconate 2-dehydrogenase subunit 3 family protein n=1 Tax=Leisingera sp. SS27 TaxID=2979462 RepID=UPI00232D77F9|nr:gluconate 2-dehydrogenase subunit 3 family protein [Leisingera sp. SS27]MDC0660550.1 gluconate 2-dehydrogenase subunit 3 family protein [Leisingera sp. SS27]